MNLWQLLQCDGQRVARLLQIRVKLAALLFASCLALVASAGAQESTQDEALDRAYNDMLQDLSNPDKAYRYAEMAYEAGRLRSAAVALERVLRLKPGAQSIRLQLGTIYYRLGVYDLARAELKEALDNGEFPESYARPARAMLADAESKLLQQVFSGNAYVGIRYDSNVTQSALVQLNAIGLATPIKRSDVGLITGGNLSHLYRFDDPNVELVTHAAGYGSIERTQGDFDYGYFYAATGPSFSLGKLGSGTVSLRPFVNIGNSIYGGDEFGWGGGAGATATSRYADGSEAEVTVKTDKRRFYNSTLRPTAAGQTDLLSTLDAHYTIRLGANQTFSVGPLAGLDNADDSSLANKQIGGRLTYALNFDGPFSLSARPWSLYATETYTAYFFRTVNLALGPQLRRDYTSDLTVSLTVPFGSVFYVALNVEYINNDSTIPALRFDDKAVFTTIGINF